MALVLLPAGVVHRVGPHRFNVKLAHAAALAGFHCLRLDLSGVGDSRTPTGARPYLEQALIDLRDALDHLGARLGVTRFIIGGICSGADHAFRAALVDDRIVGIWGLDGFTYPTNRSRWLWRWFRLQLAWQAPVRAWPGKAARMARRALSRSAPPSMGVAGAPPTSRGAPSAHVFGQQAQALTDRGVRCLLMYTGAILAHYNHAGQFAQAFRGLAFVDRVTVRYLADIDHTLTTLSAQAVVIAGLINWLNETIGPLPQPGPHHSSGPRWPAVDTPEMGVGTGTRNTTVAIICQANRCRSPVAEVVMASMALWDGLGGIRVNSRGLSTGSAGMSPDPRSQASLKSRGYAPAQSRSTPVSMADFEQADLILTMDADIHAEVRRLCPAALQYKVQPYLRQAGTGAGVDVPDPYLSGPGVFEQVVDLCEAGARDWLDTIRDGKWTGLPPSLNCGPLAAR
ncbi:MAG: alpha/beta fold hydrolase [Aquabacterium sp.]